MGRKTKHRVHLRSGKIKKKSKNKRNKRNKRIKKTPS